MKTVERTDIIDLETYEKDRDYVRKRVMAIKAPRRIHVGEHLTFLFENFETMRYQVHEMLRAEGRQGEEDILHELETYNELLGGPGELGCTLLIEIDDVMERARLLREWLELPQALYAELADGTRVRPTVDDRQSDGERLSTVQYLKFDTSGATPVALGSDLPQLTLRAELSPDQQDALTTDLKP